MNQTQLQDELRRTAEGLGPVDLLGPSLGEAKRIRVRRRSGALAGTAVLVVALVVAATTFGGRPRTTGPLHRPPAHTTTVNLDDVPQGSAPALDRIDAHSVFHAADGGQFALASPGTTADVGDWFVDGAAGLVALHHTKDGYTYSIDGGQPRPLLAVHGESYRALFLGPHATAFVAGGPGDLLVIGADGQVTHLPVAGRQPVVATWDYFWGVWHHRVWRLDPSNVAAGWSDMGRGSDLDPLYTAHAIWVSGADGCATLHDEHTFAALWHGCAGTTGQWPSLDGRFALRTTDDGAGLEVVEARTGAVVMRVRAPSGRLLVPGGTASWLGGTSLWSGDVFWLGTETSGDTPGTQQVSFACDAVRHTCKRVALPTDSRWFGTSMGR